MVKKSVNKKIVDLLKSLVSIQSDYPFEQKLTLFLEDFFISKGFSVKKQLVEKGRYNLIIKKGNGKKIIALYAHLDTVSQVENWSKNPFKLTIENDRAYGLGAYDMKAGMAINMEVFLNYEPKNIQLQLIFCVDEENISRGGHLLANSKELENVACILSPEPAFKHGVNGIVVGRIGRAVFEIEIQNTPTHYMFYDPKEDPHRAAAHIIEKLHSLYKHKKDKRQFIFVRKMESSTVGMSVPEKVTMELDSSILSPMTNDRMFGNLTQIVDHEMSKYQNIKAEIRYKKRDTPFLSGYEISGKNPYLLFLKKAVKEATGKSAIPYFRSSVADENIFGSMGKTVLGIGPTGGNAHAPDEYVTISSLEKLYTIYYSFLHLIDSSYE